MLNNKGQTLIFFAIILPVLLFILIFIIDLSYMNFEKNKLDNLAKECMEYKLDGLNNKKIEELINLNNEDTTYEINGNSVILKKEYNPIFFKILNNNCNKIISKYTGYIENGKKIIKKGDINE